MKPRLPIDSALLCNTQPKHWYVFATALALLFLSHYAAAPVNDFVLDDWVNLSIAREINSPSEIWNMAASEADRPLCLGAIRLFFAVFGDRPVAYYLVNLLTYSGFIVLLGLCALELGLRRNAALLAMASFALLPNIGEVFHWHHHAPIAYMNLSYLLCMYFWIRYAKSGRMANAALSALCYGLALFTYETGALVPAALVILLPRPTFRNLRFPALLFGSMLGLFLLWRFGVFGVKEHIINGRDYLSGSLTLWGIRYNAIQIPRWWFGTYLFDAVREGWNGFSLATPRQQRLLFSLNIIAISLLMAALLRQTVSRNPTHDSSNSPWHFIRLFCYFMAWIACTHAVSLFSWTASRLNFLPAVGVALALAATLDRLDRKAWMPLYAILAILSLMSNQGTALSWHESGRFNRSLFQHLQEHRNDWMSKKVVLFDTSALRQRLTAGLGSPHETDPRAWAYFQNAGLIRGFAPAAMLDLLADNKLGRWCLLDTETGARIKDGTLYWHHRYDPSKPVQAPLDDVYIVDCWKAAWPPR